MLNVMLNWSGCTKFALTGKKLTLPVYKPTLVKFADALKLGGSCAWRVFASRGVVTSV